MTPPASERCAYPGCGGARESTFHDTKLWASAHAFVAPAPEIESLRAQLAEAQRERDEARNLRAFDTREKTLPPGLVLEHARLDAMWQKLVAERDAARERAQKAEEANADLSRACLTATDRRDAAEEQLRVAREALVKITKTTTTGEGMKLARIAARALAELEGK